MLGVWAVIDGLDSLHANVSLSVILLFVLRVRCSTKMRVAFGRTVFTKYLVKPLRLWRTSFRIMVVPC